MKKKIIIIVLSVITLLTINQIYYLYCHQYKCTEKIEQGKSLNAYDTFSALQTHSNLWLFGWIIEPNTATICFNKQFHTINSIIGFELPKDDETLSKAKYNLLTKQSTKVKLSWKNYNSKASILLNGSVISLKEDEFGVFYQYEICTDYKPGIIKIANIPISETVFDYLENKGILSVYNLYKIQPLTKEDLTLLYK